MSNFMSSPCASKNQALDSFRLEPGGRLAEVSAQQHEPLEWSQGTELEDNAVEYAKATARLLADLPNHNRLLLASDLRQRGAAARAFASLLYPGLELSLQWNRVRFYSPRGSYWHSLRSGDQPGEPDWATGFWSMAHWGAGSTGVASGTPDGLVSARV